MIEAQFDTKLYSLILCAFSAKGFAGPNYGLDGVSAYVGKQDDSLCLSFWDMDCTINNNDKYYPEILDEIKTNRI
jgi:hypothetical protein